MLEKFGITKESKRKKEEIQYTVALALTLKPRTKVDSRRVRGENKDGCGSFPHEDNYWST